MDAQQALTAIQSGDMVALASALEWDQFDTVTMTDGVIAIARKGTVTYRFATGSLGPATGGGLMAHSHVSEMDAWECAARDLVEARFAADMAASEVQVPDTVDQIPGWGMV